MKFDTQRKALQYIAAWRKRGYPDDIPDSVPLPLMRERLAPSYQAICVAILSNDMAMESLGFLPRKSDAYMALKRIEISERESRPQPEPSLADVAHPKQTELF